MNKTWLLSLGALAVLASGCAPSNNANIKPEFDYFYTGPNDRAPLSVTFTNNTEGADSYHWNFGDGGESTEEVPVHVFQAAGTYTVTLTASTGSGSNNATKTLTVDPAYSGLMVQNLGVSSCPSSNSGNPWDTPGGSDPAGYPDLYMVIKNESMTVLTQTAPVNNQLPPVGETITYTLPSLTQTYTIELYDEDGATDQLIGTATVKPSTQIMLQPDPYAGYFTLIGTNVSYSLQLAWIP